MKILQISNYYYPHIGGIEQTARDISDALGGVCERKVFCFNHKRQNEVSVVDGVEIVKPGCFAKVASQSLSFSYGRMLKKTFREYRPDVVIFHYPNPFAAYYLKKQLKKYPDCKLVLWWHLDITKQKVLKIFFGGQTNWLLRRACRVVATSPNYIQGSPSLLAVRDKCTVIPSCVSDARAAVPAAAVARAHELREQTGDKIICFAIGRHVPYKGMEYLVRASALLDDRFVVWIGGEGELTDHLKKLAADDKKVSFLGRISDDELKGRLAACDIFCFPSITKNEAFGLALVEALACGKPAVTFTIDGSGVNYVSLNGVTGIEVQNRNVEEYARAITKLADDAPLRAQYGKNAAERVSQLFTFAKFKDNVVSLINSL